ncbi:MAG: hypothetical protein ACRDYC_07325 [Acidimicrobiales bacterium]
MADEEQDYAYWQGKVDTLQRTQLETVNAAAANWRALFGALLGIFTAAAFAGGLTTIDRLASPWDSIMKAATIVGVVAAIGAVYFANMAAGSISVELLTDQDPMALRNRSLTMAAKARTNLKRSKPLGALAVVIIVVGSATVLLLGASKPGPADVLVIVNGQAACGPLVKHAEGGITVGGTPLTGTVGQMTAVSACP